MRHRPYDFPGKIGRIVRTGEFRPIKLAGRDLALHGMRLVFPAMIRIQKKKKEREEDSSSQFGIRDLMAHAMALEDAARRVIGQIFTALSDIHKLGWMHRDVKALCACDS